ncbi:MAG: fumarate reductase subunit C [Planctomycetota bacterium]
MSGNPDYRKYHPAWYRPKVSTYWWLRRGTYVAFILREVSAIFVAWFIVYLLMLLHSVSQGAESYQQFLDWSGSVGILILNIVTLIFVLIHSVTWFNLAPQAMAVRLRGKRVPDVLISGSNYGAWALVSAFLVWILVG